VTIYLEVFAVALLSPCERRREAVRLKGMDGWMIDYIRRREKKETPPVVPGGFCGEKGTAQYKSYHHRVAPFSSTIQYHPAQQFIGSSAADELDEQW
jgi:hypothetical protein